MSRRFRPRLYERFARCPACKIRLYTGQGACSVVCENSIRGEGMRRAERVLKR